MHARDLKKAGETDERLFAVAAWREAPYFTDAERAALALAEAATRLSDRTDPVPDEVFEEAARHYDEPPLSALIIEIAPLAVTKVCNDVPCESTDRDDVLFERIGNKHDRIFGFEGRDVIDANTYNSDRDVLHGDASRDRLLTNDTDNRDRANGGRGRDTCYVSRGDTTSSCEVVHRATFGAGTSDVAQDSSAAAFAEGQ